MNGKWISRQSRTRIYYWSGGGKESENGQESEAELKNTNAQAENVWVLTVMKYWKSIQNNTKKQQPIPRLIMIKFRYTENKQAPKVSKVGDNTRLQSSHTPRKK